jgi:hypothetical protein
MTLLMGAQDLEAAVVATIQAGQMTKDLAICIHGNKVRARSQVTTS